MIHLEFVHYVSQNPHLKVLDHSLSAALEYSLNTGLWYQSIL